MTIESAEGSRAVQDVESAFLVYNNGPTPSQRAMYLAVGTREARKDAFSLEAFQFLPDNAEGPSPGTYGIRYGALGGDPTMSGSVMIWEGSALTQFFPGSEFDSVSLEAVTRDRVSGRFQVTRIPSGGVFGMTIRGTFMAERVERYEDLPVVRPRPQARLLEP